MASNAKWIERLTDAITSGDLTYWNNNKGFLSPGDQALLEDKYLPKAEVNTPKAVVPKPEPIKEAKKDVPREAPTKAPAIKDKK
jgi:hypothetical protein